MRRSMLVGVLLLLAATCCLAQGFQEGFEGGLGPARSYHNPPDETKLEAVAGDAAEGKQFLRAVLPGRQRLEGVSLAAKGLAGARLATVTAKVRGKGEAWLCLYSRSGWLYARDTTPLTGRWQEISLSKVLVAADTELGISFLSKNVQTGAVFEVDDVRVTLAAPAQVTDASVGPWRFEAEAFTRSASYVAADETALGGKAVRHAVYLAIRGVPFPRTRRPVTIYARVKPGSVKESYRLVTFQGGNEQYLATVKPEAAGGWQWLRGEAVLAGEVGDSFGLACFREKDENGEAALDAVVLSTTPDLTDAQLAAAPVLPLTGALTVVARAETPPARDGAGDDPCWRDAVACTGFLGMGSQLPAQADTAVRLCYDDKNLYVLFVSQEPILNTAQQRRHEFAARVRERDGEVYQDDCAVVLLDPAGDGKRVLDFTANALGTVADAVCAGTNLWDTRDTKWNSGARAAGKVGEDVWSVEMAIPLADLGPAPAPGTVWKAVLGRIARARKETTSWNPSRLGFHDPLEMGSLVFAGRAPGVMVQAPAVLQPGKNEVAATLGPAVTQATDKAEAGGVLLFSTQVAGGETQRDYTFAPPGKEPARAVHRFEVSREGELRFGLGALDAATLQPLFLTPAWPRTVRSTVATVRLACDGPYELFLNDEVIGRGAQADGAEIKAPLGKGANVFALRLEKGTAAVRIEAPGATFDGETWRMAPAETKAATLAATDDAAWERARKTGEHPRLGAVVGDAGKGVVLRRTLLWEKTRVWPTPEPAFYLARGGAQHFNLLVDGLKGKKLQEWTTYIATPPEYEVVGSSGFYGTGRPTQPLFVCTPAGEREIGGRGMRGARIRADKPVGLAGHYIMGMVNAFVRYREDAGEPKSGETTFLYWSEANNGSVSEPPQSIKVRLLPRLEGKQPKQLVWQLWAGWLSNLDDLPMREEILKTARAAGFNNVVSGDEWTAKTGPRYGIRDTLCINFEAWSLNMAPYLKEHPEARLVTAKGEPSDKLACTTALLGDSWPAVEAALREKMEKARPHVVEYDFEFAPPTGPHSCYCARCLQAFRDAAKLPADAKLDGQSIGEGHAAAWTEFVSRRNARVFARLKESVHRVAPGTLFAVYSGYQTPRNPEEYGVDWRIVGELQAVDEAGCGYGRPTEAISATIAGLRGIPLVVGALIYPYDTAVLTPCTPLTKAWALRCALDATGGVLVYDRLSMDGRTWLAVAEATRVVAAHEEVFLRGARTALPGLDPAQVQVVAAGRTTLVCALNETGKPVTHRIPLPAAAGAGREFATGKKVAAGETVACTLEPGDAVVWVLTSQ